MRFTPTSIALTVLAVSLCAHGVEVNAPSPEGVEYFEKHVRPVLVERCYECHAAGKKVKGKLLVDSRDGLLKGGESGPAVVPGNPDKSVLITAIRYSHEELQMPPKTPLTKDQVAAFVKWVGMGAPDPRVAGAATDAPAVPSSYDFAKAKQFWSFKPVNEPAVPTVRDAAWPANNVDRFLLAKMEAKGLTPAGPADKVTLIRRATYDLTGLPPTPEEVDAFVNDSSANAFARLVDRLLASPAYGEKWGRQWLDVVRYADTSGCNSDFPVPDLYKYRNWVIESFNADKPYDQFIREQLAGDLLPANDVDDRNKKIIATGYIANARRFGSRNDEFHLTIEDTIDNLGRGLLGVSIGCARCHDHKYDPIPATDYYALYGIFASTKYAFPGTEIYPTPKDMVALGGPEEAKVLAAWEGRLAELDDKYEIRLRERDRLASAEKRAKELEAKNGPATAPSTKPARTSQTVQAEMDAMRAEQKQLRAKPPTVAKAYAVSEGKIGDAKVQIKGERKMLGAEVRRGFLTVLGGQKLPSEEKGSGRLQLADWVADPKNPLTARVMVNRIWQGHFGKGIVPTVNDFGTRGERPTHPELLDYLASQFVKGGWSVKSIHRQVMLSRAYQLAVADDPKNTAVDPANDYHWRFNPRRLSAEEIRDSILALAGTLDRSAGGPHPFPRQAEWTYSQHRPFVDVFETTRRSVYLMQQRIRKEPFLATFDGADTNAPTGVRPISTTAIQALWMMNDKLMHEQSEKFAARLELAGSDPREQIVAAYRLTYGRAPTPDEIETATNYVNAMTPKVADTGTPADQRPRAALASLARVLFASNEFLFLE